jgi:hypothetical protein
MVRILLLTLLHGLAVALLVTGLLAGVRLGFEIGAGGLASLLWMTAWLLAVRFGRGWPASGFNPAVMALRRQSRDAVVALLAAADEARRGDDPALLGRLEDAYVTGRADAAVAVEALLATARERVAPAAAARAGRRADRLTARRPVPACPFAGTAAIAADRRLRAACLAMHALAVDDRFRPRFWRSPVARLERDAIAVVATATGAPTHQASRSSTAAARASATARPSSASAASTGMR